MPSSIVPTRSFTKLGFETSKFDNAETHTQFYQYIAKMYVNINYINYRDDKLDVYDPDKSKQIYANGMFDFFKLIGPIKNDFCLRGLPDGVDGVFEVFDAVDARINKLNFKDCEDRSLFQCLSRSKQFHYIEEISIVSIRLDSIHLLKDMPVLTSLEFYSLYPNSQLFHLVDCLDACPPSLNSLFIDCKNLEAKPYKTELCSIKDLYIGFRSLSSDLGKILSFYFSNLVKLTLIGEVTENTHITLKSPQFQEARFSTDGVIISNYCTHGFSFKSPGQTETQHYLGNEQWGDYKIRNKSKVTYDDIKHLPILSVESFRDATLEGGIAMEIKAK